MNKPIAQPFGSMPRRGLNAQVTLAPAVGTFGVLAGSTATGSQTVVVGNLGPPAGLPESLGIGKMKKRDPKEAFGCKLGALSAGQESKLGNLGEKHT